MYYVHIKYSIRYKIILRIDYIHTSDMRPIALGTSLTVKCL